MMTMKGEPMEYYTRTLGSGKPSFVRSDGTVWELYHHVKKTWVPARPGLSIEVQFSPGQEWDQVDHDTVEATIAEQL